MHFSKTLAPLLSVIVPVTRMANKFQNLIQWLETVKEQPIEIIVIHDIQDFDTSLEIKTIVAQFDQLNLQFIEGEYGSPGMARNAGIKLATGEWLAFWDSDDIPEVINVITNIKHCGISNTDYIIGNFVECNEITGVKVKHILGKRLLIDVGLNPGLWRFIFKRATLNDLQFSNLLIAEDQEFLARYMTRERVGHVSNDFFYNYFIGGNYHLTKRQEALDCMIDALLITLKIMRLRKPANSDLLALLFTRQFLATLKYSLFRYKIKSLIILCYSMFVLNYRMSFSIFKSFFLILRFRAPNEEL